MQRMLLIFSAYMLFAPLGYAQEPAEIDFEVVSQNADFQLQGEYVSESAVAANDATGAATNNSASQPSENTLVKAAQIVALGDGLFRVAIYNGGLPGAGWDRKPPQVIPDEETEGVRDLLEALHLKKVSRTSPTLGAEPPPQAIVLFDGTEATLQQHWEDGAKLSSSGWLEQGATTKDTFTDFTAHVEFLLPFSPKARGQGRGNSGIYYQGRYETQVLDSFGLEGKNNETGGIYEIRDPNLNMCFPPLTWQTYDVDFTAARWDENGKKIKNAKMTVRLNGIVVQRDVEVPRITRAAPVQESPEPGPLYIQNHGNPVRYRNIWVLPRDADQEARRPIIPGFERFHGNGESAELGGQILLSELGCAHCHATNTPVTRQIKPKQAPILTDVGSRVRPEWLMQFLSDPHTAKPGTTMPNLFMGWAEAERNQAVLALANFLASSGQVAERMLDRPTANKGARLFREIGCIACHAPQDGKVAVSESMSVPLGNLAAKYSIPSLAEFLKNPHAVRPAGRMPSLLLEKEEPVELASYLLRDSSFSAAPNVNFKAYHGSWQELPDFDSMKPEQTGVCSGFDLSAAGKDHQFGLRFEGYFVSQQAGDHTFWLGSDDGSILTIDGTEIINVDGIHPHSTQEKKVRLEAGVHQLRVDYFEQGGDVSLRLEFQPPGGQRQDLPNLLTTNADGKPVERDSQPADTVSSGLAFRRDPNLVSQGKELFATLGCANCHELKQGNDRIASTLKAKSFQALDLNSGCLAAEAAKEERAAIPDFELSPIQRQTVIAALSQTDATPFATAEHQVQQTLTRFNCVACHVRGGVGGPEADRNPLFLTSQNEMGDEGRIPPPLDGVGDKLQERWLTHIFNNGVNERPYMKTRMPKFGGSNVGQLTKALIDLDRRDEAQLAEFDEPEHRVKSSGRQLVGERGLACIKCHTFGKFKATGIQAISLTSMTSRIREDWFLRYLYDPAKYRPGTRMPTGFPDGKAVIRDVYAGDPNQQLTAIWTYLKDEEKAGIPEGLVAEMIELKPVSEPILYRNFIEGMTPRGIAVGYPEKAHLGWDANDLCLKLIWHGRFIDASKHWVGRGPGNQVPLGDHQLQLEPTVPVAQLESRETPWPGASPRSLPGYEFRGYSLNEAGQPTFRYETPTLLVQDFPKPVADSERGPRFERQLRFETQNRAEPIENAYFRAAVGKQIEEVNGAFLVDGAMTIALPNREGVFIRTSGNQSELLVPLNLEEGTDTLTQVIIW